MGFFSHTSAFAQVTALASLRPVHGAFGWLHLNERKIMDWQAEMVAIPAPPFGEKARGEWLAARFADAGLSNVRIDDAGNVLGTLLSAGLLTESSGPVVILSAHIDTVFPADTPLNPIRTEIEGIGHLQGPGACDNGAGVAGLLAVAHALKQARVELAASLTFLGNVGEEGEGDLRGVRRIYSDSALAGRIAAHIVLDGAGADSAVTQAVGSRRYLVRISGPGGHSFTDAGTPNPIAALSVALAELAQTPLPEEPRTTLNIGTVHGGTSVNSIPEMATASVDFRSTNPDQILRLEVALHRAVEDAVERTNAIAAAGRGRSRGALRFEIEKIGDRPAGQSGRRFRAVRIVACRGPASGVEDGSAPEARPMPICRSRWEFRLSPSARAAMAEARTRRVSGSAAKIASWASNAWCC